VYSSLRSYVWLLVRHTNLQPWLGQQYDVVEDIIQETVVRAYLSMRQAEEGMGQPIAALQNYCHWVAHNLCEDMRRKDTHLFHLSLDDHYLDIGDMVVTSGSWSDPIEEALEKIALLSVFVELAHLISELPEKRRIALLVDLANLSDFGSQPGPLESALSGVDINLKEYQRPIPLDPRLRSQHSALLCLAYGRLREKARALDLIA
jgi:DNA-directed RNA polymerase specialized sigma24 family protein